MTCSARISFCLALPEQEKLIIPLKWLLKFVARVAGKNSDFIDHLKFVHPRAIERLLNRIDVRFQNVYVNKLKSILVDGHYDLVVGRKKYIKILSFFRYLRITHFIYILFVLLRIYPSIEYRIEKRT